MPPNNHLAGACCQVLLWVRNGVEVGKQSKDYSVLANFPEYGKPQAGEYVRFASLESLNGEGKSTPLQYSCMENPMKGGAC